MDKKKIARLARHRRIRKRIRGTSSKPRLCVFRSLRNFYAQIIDDTQQKTLLSLSTIDKRMRGLVAYGGNLKATAMLGEEIAKLASKKGITEVVFDRGGYAYHGKVKAFAEAARSAGLKF